MEPTSENFLRCIQGAIQKVNETGAALPLEPESLLLGQDGVMSSLSLVNLMVLLEERVEENFGVSLNLIDQDESYLPNGPFYSISSLQSYLSEKLSS